MISFVRKFIGQRHAEKPQQPPPISVDLPDRNEPTGSSDIRILRQPGWKNHYETAEPVSFDTEEAAAASMQMLSYLENGRPETLADQAHRDLRAIALIAFQPLEQARQKIGAGDYLAGRSSGSPQFEAIMARYQQIEQGVVICQTLLQDRDTKQGPDLHTVLAAARTLDRSLRPDTSYGELQPDLQKLRAISALAAVQEEKASGPRMAVPAAPEQGPTESLRRATEFEQQQAFAAGTDADIAAAREAAVMQDLSKFDEVAFFDRVALIDKEIAQDELKDASRMRAGRIRALQRLQRCNDDPFASEALKARETMIRENLVLDPERRAALITTLAQGEALAAIEDEIAFDGAMQVRDMTNNKRAGAARFYLASKVQIRGKRCAEHLGGESYKNIPHEDRSTLAAAFPSGDQGPMAPSPARLSSATDVLMRAAARHSVSARVEVKTLRNILGHVSSITKDLESEDERA